MTVQTEDGGIEQLADVAATRETRPRKKRQRGAIAQVILFTSIWSALVSAFGLLAALPTLMAASAANLPPEEVTKLLMSSSSATTLGLTAATALGTILSVWIMQRFFDGPALLDLGLRRQQGWVTDSVVGLVLGPVMFVTMLLVLVAAGWASLSNGTMTGQKLATAFGTYLFVAFSEEVFARGWVLQVLERGRGRLAAVIGSAAIFSLLHAFNPGFGIMALLGLFLAGLLFAQAYLVTRQLWLPMALHLSWNFSEGPLLGFPVSGLPGDGLLLSTPTGPEVVTGGQFGPEAGLILVFGIALASALIWALGCYRPARA